MRQVASRRVPNISRAAILREESFSTKAQGQSSGVMVSWNHHTAFLSGNSRSEIQPPIMGYPVAMSLVALASLAPHHGEVPK